jgi:outer membrane autotransporter protein
MNENSSIVNNGTIEVSTITKTGEVVGIAHYGEMIDESKIVNSNTGIINAISEYGKEGVGLLNEDFAQSFGITVNSMRNKSSIVNEGTILVDSKNISKEAKNYNFGIATDSMFDETFIINSGKVEVKINDKLDYRASSIFNYYSENSTIVNEKEGQLSGNIVLLADKNTRDNGNITLNNKGSISLPYNANKDAIVLNDDENRVDSMRPYIPNLVNSGTIEIGAFKDSAGNIENTQILTRNATFEKGSKMQVAVMSGSEAFNLGDTLAAVVKSIDKLTVNELILNQTKLVDNSATLDFEYKIVDENQIDLFVSNVNKISDVIIDDKDNNQNTDNKIPIAIILDKYRDNPTFGSIISKIDAMESASEISKAMDSIVPTISSSLLNTSSQITSSILNIVSNRLGNIKFGLNSGDEIISDDDRVWVKAFGSLGEQKDKDSIYGFDLKTYGVAIGYDKEYEYEQVIGLAAFYTNANVETNHVNHTNNIDAYSIVAYGSNLLIDNKTTIYYQASNTWQRNDSKREIFTGEIADSKFTSKALALDLKVGHEININENLSVEPKIGTTYKHFVNPSYKENGAGVLNVQSNKFTSSEFIGNIGTDVEYKMTDNSKLIASVGAGYNFRKSNRNITSSFEGTSDVIFDTKGIDNGRWKYHAGIGYDLTFDNQSNFNVFYKYLGEGSKYSNNVVTLNYIYKF